MHAPVDAGAVRTWLLSLQSSIVAGLEGLDGQAFRTDAWERPGGGGGLSRVIENGNILERGGVLFSHVTGSALPPSASAQRPALAGRPFEAMGM